MELIRVKSSLQGLCVRCREAKLSLSSKMVSVVKVYGRRSLALSCRAAGNSNWPLAGDLSCQQLHRTLSKRGNIFQCSPPIKNRELRVEKCVHLWVIIPLGCRGGRKILVVQLEAFDKWVPGDNSTSNDHLVPQHTHTQLTLHATQNFGRRVKMIYTFSEHWAFVSFQKQMFNFYDFFFCAP